MVACLTGRPDIARWRTETPLAPARRLGLAAGHRSFCEGTIQISQPGGRNHSSNPGLNTKKQRTPRPHKDRPKTDTRTKTPSRHDAIGTWKKFTQSREDAKTRRKEIRKGIAFGFLAFKQFLSVLELRTTIRPILVFLTRFSCGDLHKLIYFY